MKLRQQFTRCGLQVAVFIAATALVIAKGLKAKVKSEQDFTAKLARYNAITQFTCSSTGLYVLYRRTNLVSATSFDQFLVDVAKLVSLKVLEWDLSHQRIRVRKRTS